MQLYPEDTPSRFGFDSVQSSISHYCRTDRARQFAETLKAVSERDSIELWLKQSAEAQEVIDNGLYFPDYGFPSVAHELGLLRVANAVLEGAQAIKLRKLAETAASLIRFLGSKKELYPHLRQIVVHLSASKELIAIIDEVLEPNGFVKTTASRDLGKIRKGLSEARQKAAKAFEATLRKYKRLGWLREFDESFYNDRRVLAVTAEYKRKIDGTLHGSSETGSTAYIEPAALVPLNNEVAEYLQAEKREEYRILKELSAKLRSFLGVLESYEHALGFLDFTFAKARYARSIDGSMPVISGDKSVELINAYHPLLLLQNRRESKETVPMSLSLDKDHRVLVISGPNAGGKSISLKTFGLLQLMFQSGIPVSAAAHSRFAVFSRLFVDIGDDQSIAYELSTYSSRLVKMRHFLLQANKQSLFFIDEFGTGSDPELGGAIAEAILEQLADTRAMGVITTHYANIKILAEKHPALLNACMLFDERTLLPKYQLHVGYPGSSYTFEVARKIGLSEELIAAAKSKLDQRKVYLDKLLNTLQAKKNQLNRETSTLQREKSDIRKEIAAYRKEAELLKQKEDDLNFRENKRLIEKGKRYERLLSAWQEKKQRKDLIKTLNITAEKDAARQREKDEAEKLREKQERIRKQRAKRKKKKSGSGEQSVQDFAVGQKVKLKRSNQVGVVEEINKDKVTVLFGMMKTIVPAEKLILLD